MLSHMLPSPAAEGCKPPRDPTPAGTPAPRSWPRGLRIRQCKSSDAAELWALFNEDSYQQSGTLLDGFASSADVMDWLVSNQSGKFEVVALTGGAVVGFAGLYPLPGRQSHAGYVSVGVASACQRRGYGGALLRVVLATADHLVGLSRLQLYVLTDNSAAIALYQGGGFHIEGRHAGFARRSASPDDRRYVDAWSMARIRTTSPLTSADHGPISKN